MGLETALAVGGLALGAVSAGTQTFMSSQHAAAQADAAKLNFDFRNAELTRQQSEINRVAEEDKSDIVRQAEQALGAIRVAASEVGATGSTSFMRMLAEVGAAEGRDLSRIERNRKESVASVQASKRAAAVSGQNVVRQAQNEQTAGIVDATLGFIGTGLQIGTGYHRRRVDLELAKNRKTVT